MWRVDNSSGLHLSVYILFSCYISPVPSFFLSTPPLAFCSMTTDNWSPGESLLHRGFRNARLQIKSSNFLTALLFSVLRMETFLFPSVKMHSQSLTSNTSLLQCLTLSTSSHSQQCQTLAVSLTSVVIPSSTVLSNNFSFQIYFLRSVKSTEIFSTMP